jgi:hypothetical protein
VAGFALRGRRKLAGIRFLLGAALFAIHRYFWDRGGAFKAYMIRTYRQAGSA